MPSDPPPPENELTPETRAAIERAERAWQRQVEHERRGLNYPGPMNRLRWVMIAIAALSLLLLLVTNGLGG